MSRFKISDFIDQIGDGIHGTPIYMENGEYYFINGNNLIGGEIVISGDTLRISKEEYNRIKRPLNENTILMSINGTLGKIAMYRGEKVALGKSACYINVKQDKNKYFVKYILTTKEFQKYILLVAHGSTIKNLAPSQVAEYEFDIPDGLDQDNVAFLLKAIDDKIQNNSKINIELESMAKTIYDYWFLQYEFPDENGRPYKSSGGKVVRNKELKKEIPEGWEVADLKDIASITMGTSPKGDSINTDGEGIVFYQGKADFGNRFPITRTYTNAPIRYADVNDILLSIRAPVGTLNIANKKCCIGRGLAAIHSKYNSFMYYLMLANQYKFDIYNNGGTTFGAITKDNLFGMRVVIPNKFVIDKFEQKINCIEQKIYRNHEENQELISLRNFLLPLLMNGQVGFK